MFELDYDSIPTDHLLTDLGIDVNAVRESIADDLARHYPTARSWPTRTSES